MAQKEESEKLNKIMAEFPNGLFYFNLESKNLLDCSMWHDHLTTYANKKVKFTILESGRVILVSYKCEYVVNLLRGFAQNSQCYYEGYYWQFPLNPIHLVKINASDITLGKCIGFSIQYQEDEHLQFVNDTFNVFMPKEDFWFIHHHRYYPYKNKINKKIKQIQHGKHTRT